MIRVMFDTNVYISTLINPLGIPAQCVQYAEVNCDIYTCKEILNEVDNVSQRDMFRRYFGVNESIEFVNSLELNAIISDSNEYPFLSDHIKDKSKINDILIFSAFVNSKANYLVTGNTKDFPKDERILTPRQFLELTKISRNKFLVKNKKEK